MICQNCGTQNADGAKFCASCGAALASAVERAAPNTGTPALEGTPAPPTGSRYVTKNIMLCADGKYRWVYEFSMMKNSTVLITCLKVMGIACGVLVLLVTLMALKDAPYSPEPVAGYVLKSLIPVVGVSVFLMFLTVVSYLILAALKGGKYVVAFEMDEESVIHMEVSNAYDKVKVLSALGLMIGAVQGNLTLAASSFNAMVNRSISSTWSKVKSVKSNRRKNVIFVNEVLYKNQVYAEDEDFDFVESFIRSHCRTASISEKKPAGPVFWVVLVLCLALAGFGIYRGVQYTEYRQQMMSGQGDQEEVAEVEEEETESGEKEAEEETGSTGEQKQREKKTGDEVVVKMGGTYKAQDLEFSVDDVTFGFNEVSPIEMGKLKTGEKYLKVDFTFKNISDSDQDFSVHDFDCYVEDAFCEQWDVPPLTLDMYHEGTSLSVGEEITFSNLYAVPEEADSAELEYNKGEWTQERVIVELKK